MSGRALDTLIAVDLVAGLMWGVVGACLVGYERARAAGQVNSGSWGDQVLQLDKNTGVPAWWEDMQR